MDGKTGERRPEDLQTACFRAGPVVAAAFPPDLPAPARASTFPVDEEAFDARADRRRRSDLPAAAPGRVPKGTLAGGPPRRCDAGGYYGGTSAAAGHRPARLEHAGGQR